MSEASETSPPDGPPLTVGVVGTGQMGAGIMQVAAVHGHRVIAVGRRTESLERASITIDRMLRIAVRKEGLSSEVAEAAKTRITSTQEVADLAPCDLVIESIAEELEPKQSLFRQLDELLADHAILASNTSALSVTEIGSVTNRQDRVCGLHFFNPVPMMELLEVVRTDHTSDETYERAAAFGRSLGKRIVTAVDHPGFIVNFLLMPLLLGAARLYEQGLATREDIDTGMKLGLGHPKGPLELLDVIGTDTALHVAESISSAFPGKAEYEPPKIIKDLVAAGKFGRKSGEGFYTYRKPS